MTHDAEGRVQGFVNVWLAAPGRDAIERIHADRAYELRATDLRTVLQSLADTRQERDAARAESPYLIRQYEGFVEATRATFGGLAHKLAAAEAELADTRQQLDEAIDLDRSALKHQELRDERHRAVKAWHDEHKRAKAAEGRLRAVEALLTSGPIGRASGERYVRADFIRAAIEAGPTQQGHDTTTSEQD
jgi:hypothetical protein